MEPTHSIFQRQTSERTRFGGLFFEPPQGWRAREILVYEAPTSGRGGPPSRIVLTNETREPGLTFQAHALKVLLRLSKELEDFIILETGELRVGGRHATRMRYSARTPWGELEQLLFHIDAPDGGTITITCTAPPGDAGPSLETLERLLASVRFTHTPPGAPAETPPAPRTVPPSPAPRTVPPSPRAPQLDFVPPPAVPMPGAPRRRSA